MKLGFSELYFSPKKEDKVPYDEFKKDCMVELTVDLHVDEWFSCAFIVQPNGTFSTCKTKFTINWDKLYWSDGKYEGLLCD
tara:strand:+ start:177 stop:419 length:243 start_codon:yes stop_codon:yes gene_type:complete